MTVEPAQAALQHVADVAHIFKQNCVLRNNLPEAPPRLTIGKLPALPAQQAAAPAPQPIDTPVATSPTTTTVPVDAWAWAKKAAVVGAALAAGGGIPAAVTALWPKSHTEIVAPAHPNDQSDVSLLQYLQEQGKHLPVEAKP